MSTYTPIASITLASASSSVTFSGIPQTYTDLVLVTSVKYTSSSSHINLQYNGDTNNNYSNTVIYGDGTSAVSGRDSNVSFCAIGRGGTEYGVGRTHIQNYTNNTTFKTTLSRGDLANSITIAYVSLYRSTAAITSATLSANVGSFDTGSTFNLYGIANASITNVAKATGGDSVYTDGTYWYHTFLSSGIFTPTQALTADYLVVAGGGASSQGGGASGGGGAGGVRCTVGATGGGGALESPLSLTAQAYAVTIGAGGAGGTGTTSNGSNSVFSTITATGGGRSGGPNPNQNGASGGSGGGGGEQIGTYGTGGAGTANQGYAGGNAGSATYRMGGGGGAGAAGVNGGSSSGNGGAGITTTISGTSVTYGGGGGGASNSTPGTGGAGGGGNGGASAIGTAGTANTGGGGGGSYIANGVAGGSGIVIVRYAV